MTASLRLGWVEGVRGVACLIVVVFHWLSYFYPVLVGVTEPDSGEHGDARLAVWAGPFAVLWSGGFAVRVFFVLSGFVFAQKTLATKDTKHSTSALLRRYFRMVIPVQTIIIIVLLMKYMRAFDATTRIASYGYVPPDPPSSGLADALYQGLVKVWVGYSMEYVAVLWTMQPELRGSFLVLLLALVQPAKRGWLFVVFFALFCMTPVTIVDSDFQAYACFAYGLIVALTRHNWPTQPPRGVVPLLLALSLFFAIPPGGDALSDMSYFGGLKSIVAFYTSADPPLLYTQVWTIFAAALFFTAVAWSDTLQSMFGVPPLVYVGRISFSLYLVHMPLMSSMGTALVEHLIDVQALSWNAAVTVSALVCIPTLWLVGHVFYVVVDKNAIRFGPWAERKLFAPATNPLLPL